MRFWSEDTIPCNAIKWLKTVSFVVKKVTFWSFFTVSNSLIAFSMLFNYLLRLSTCFWITKCFFCSFSRLFCGSFETFLQAKSKRNRLKSNTVFFIVLHRLCCAKKRFSFPCTVCVLFFIIVLQIVIGNFAIDCQNSSNIQKMNLVVFLFFL